MVDTEAATSGLVRCLRMNVNDPESRVSSSYWIDSDWMDERYRLYGFPQVTVFQVGSSSYNSKSGTMVYFPQFQIDIFTTGTKQKNIVADEVKSTVLVYRNTLSNSGVGIDSLTGEVDSIEDERVPLKTYRKTLTYSAMIYSSG